MQMPTKNRGKSAAIVSDHTINLLNVNADVIPPASVQSPLKIESVNPMRNKNATNRLLQRSYSTLGLNYLNTVLSKSENITNQQASTTASAALVTAKKSTLARNAVSNSNQNLVENPIENGFSNRAIASSSSPRQNVHRGFWRIQRTVKEREKLPDRINLDRRGLATLPLIVDEPNLRLLSLQHNLINSLCVPAPNTSENKNSDCLSLLTTVELVKKPPSSDNIEANRLRIKSTNVSTNNERNSRCLIRTQSIQKPPSSSSRSLTRNFSINSASTIARNRFGSKPIDPSGNHHPQQQQQQQQQHQQQPKLIRQNSTQAIIGRASMLPSKSALLHSKQDKYVLKKSNSFIKNYSEHLGRLIQGRNNGHNGHNGGAKGSGTVAGRGNEKTTQFQQQGSSFSSDSLPDVELQAATEMLLTKNDPFSGFAQCLQNLVFLDLYDNQIERISSLDGLISLTVLLLGKNRINDISGIVSVKKTLRVLDLHGNKIGSIAQKICQLHELKSLNLAGNHLKQIQEDDFKGLTQLKELNLKRNRIKKLNGFDDLHALERLWLCHNDIEKVSQVACLTKATNLREITIENNPVSLAGDCISFLVSHLKRLSLFNLMQVTDQVRRAAMEWRHNKDTSDGNHSELSSEIRREEIISNARTNWELLRSQQIPQKHQKLSGNGNSNSNRNNLNADTEVESNLSENVIIDRKIIRQKTQLMRKNVKKSATKMKRSSSQENNSSSTSNEIRLPPIVMANSVANGNANIEMPMNSSCGSSGGVNIDSTSSHIHSEIDEFVTNTNAIENNKKLIATKSNNVNCVSNGNDVFENDKLTPTTNIDPNLNRRTPQPPATATATTTTTINETNQEIDSCDAVSLIHSEKPTQLIDEIDSELLTNTNTLIDNIDESMSAITNTNINKTTINVEIGSNSNNSHEKLSISTQSKTKGFNKDNKKSTQYVPVSMSMSASTASQQRLSISPSPVNSSAAAAAAATPPPPPTASVAQTPKLSKFLDREREQGGDYLIEICGRYLNVYGSGAIKFIDRQWNVQKANDVHTLKFSYVNFNSVAMVFGRIKNRFPNADHFTFRETNIQYLGQLNALAELQGLKSLTIEAEGNPIYLKQWRSYAIYRLSHWGIKIINEIEITKDEVDMAESIYSGLSDLVFWSLPETLIEPLLARLNLDESNSAEGEEGASAGAGVEQKSAAKQWLLTTNPSLRSVVGKEALQWKGTTTPMSAHGQESEYRQRGRQCLTMMMENTCNSVEKLQKLQSTWSTMLVDLIKTTLIDYTQIDSYLNDLMTEIGVTKPNS